MSQAAGDLECPICKQRTKRPAYVAYCMHQFCFRCIRRWSRSRDTCPICRHPMEQLFHLPWEDGTFEEYVIAPGLSNRLRRRMMMDRARSRSPQRRYNLRSRPTTRPSAGTFHSPQRQDACQGPSDATNTEAPASHESTPLRVDKAQVMAQPAPPLQPCRVLLHRLQ